MSGRLFVCLYTLAHTFLPARVSACHSDILQVSPLVCVFVHLNVRLCLSVCPSVCVSIGLCVRPSVFLYLHVRLSVCLSANVTAPLAVMHRHGVCLLRGVDVVRLSWLVLNNDLSRPRRRGAVATHSLPVLHRSRRLRLEWSWRSVMGRGDCTGGGTDGWTQGKNLEGPVDVH